MPEVLYRKWRPQTFEGVVGQEHVVRTLRNAVGQGRIAHAYLFTGPRGTGKTTMGRLLAKAVNCTSSDDRRPCGECPLCQSIGQGRSLDLIELDAASERGIDDIRALRETIKFSPSEGRYKVYILDEAHMLTEPAWNALLKTLEEPPPHVILVLVTTEPGKVPLTILSRCQRYDFHLFSVPEILARLKEVAEREGLAISEEALEFIARQARGAMRDALSLMDQFTAFTDEEIGLAEVQRLLGAVGWDAVAALADAHVDGDLGRSLSLLDGLLSGGIDPQQLAGQIVEYWRGLLLLKSGGAYHGAQLPPEILEHMAGQAQRLDLGRILQGVRLFSQARWEMRGSTNPYLPLELVLVELTSPQAKEAKPAATPASPAPAATPPTATPPAPPKATPPRQNRPQNRPPSPPPSPPAPRGDASLARLNEAWPQIVEEVWRQRRVLGEILRLARPVALDGDTLVVGAADGLQRDKLSEAVNKTVVADALRKVLGRGYALRPTLVDGLPGPDGPGAVDDPLAIWARDDLGAQISEEKG